MSRLREWLGRLAGSFGGGRRDSDLREELRTHVEMASEQSRAPQHVGVIQAMEAQRDQRGFTSIAGLGRDVRYAVRSLLRDRGSVALAVLALSLGVGATTVIFSVVYSVFVDAFPFADSTRVVQFELAANGKTIRGTSFPADEFAEFRARNGVFTHVLGGANSDVLYQWQGVTYYAKSFHLDPQALPALGVRPVIGRAVTDADGTEDAPPTFLISDRLWAARFNRDPGVLGMTLKLNGTSRTLIAVVPPRFLFGGADMFFPTTITASTTWARVGGPNTEPLSVWTLAVLKPGVTKDQAAANIALVARNVAELFPSRYPVKDMQATVRTLADRFTTTSLKDMVWILAGAVLMLLLIACSNVGSLLLARATARETELALRASLGASRGRLVRQLLTESAVLAATGAVIGGFLAYGGIEWVRATIPRSALPSEMEIRFSGPALVAGVGVSMVVALLCGLAPALRAARGDLHSRLLSSGKGVGTRSGRPRLRTTLVTVQVTLAIVLLVGSGLMLRTLLELQDIDPGFNPKNVLAVQVEYPREQEVTREQRFLFLKRIVDRLRAISGIEAVSPSFAAPHQSVFGSLVQIPGTSQATDARTVLEFIGEDYFRVSGVPLVGGRLPSASEVAEGRPVAVVNRRFGQEFLAGTNPVGRVVSFASVDRGAAQSRTLFEIVGVVGDTRNAGLREDAHAEAYLPYIRNPTVRQTILVRTNVDPRSLIHTIRREVASLNPDVALMNPGGSFVGTMLLEEMVDRVAFAGPKFGLGLMATFGAVGLTLCAIGIFSVMAYTVSLQTREIGVRMALGAEPGGVVRLVVLRGMRPIAIGTVIGIGVAYGLSRLMANQIYGVSATDPWTFAAVVVVLAGVGLLACLFPVRRAIRVDPLIALRSD